MEFQLGPSQIDGCFVQWRSRRSKHSVFFGVMLVAQLQMNERLSRGQTGRPDMCLCVLFIYCFIQDPHLLGLDWRWADAHRLTRLTLLPFTPDSRQWTGVSVPCWRGLPFDQKCRRMALHKWVWTRDWHANPAMDTIIWSHKWSHSQASPIPCPIHPHSVCLGVCLIDIFLWRGTCIS